ncbi:hypothetical protein HDU98_010139 [Podochytrium sp. JEL0797]|nr:hypothetical protein HDU98_010139 [Podochytrium sp. JEL0797]
MSIVKDPNVGELKSNDQRSEPIVESPPAYVAFESGPSQPETTTVIEIPIQPPVEPVPVMVELPGSIGTRRPLKSKIDFKFRTGCWPIDLVISLVEAAVRLVVGILMLVFRIVLGTVNCLLSCFGCRINHFDTQ